MKLCHAIGDRGNSDDVLVLALNIHDIKEEKYGSRPFVRYVLYGIAYTVDQAVGKACPNRRDDVLLVQFFLKVVSEGPEQSDFTPDGFAPMNIDGLWGPISQAFLNQYIAVNSAQNTKSPAHRGWPSGSGCQRQGLRFQD